MNCFYWIKKVQKVTNYLFKNYLDFITICLRSPKLEKEIHKKPFKKNGKTQKKNN